MLDMEKLMEIHSLIVEQIKFLQCRIDILKEYANKYDDLHAHIKDLIYLKRDGKDDIDKVKELKRRIRNEIMGFVSDFEQYC